MSLEEPFESNRYEDQFASVSDLSTQPIASMSDVQEAIFGKKTVAEKLDNVGRSLGLLLPKGKAKKKMQYNNRLLAPNNQEDADFLNELLNNAEKYQVVSSDRTWTPQGDYRIFVIYLESVGEKV